MWLVEFWRASFRDFYKTLSIISASAESAVLSKITADIKKPGSYHAMGMGGEPGCSHLSGARSLEYYAHSAASSSKSARA